MIVKIREVDITDFESVCQLFSQENLFHVKLLPDRFRVANPILTKKRFEEIIADNDNYMFVAQNEDQVLGVALIKIVKNDKDPLLKPNPYVYLQEIVIKSNQQRKGIGRKMMSQIHEWAKKKGLYDIELSVWGKNENAINFYKSLGYEELQKRMEIKLK